uniref:Nidogen n=2 Tax=Bombyx mori TaxID=7091 RepID=A0A8R2G7Q2_BOMMO|nr:low density lipoprotein receptor isoform X1 [Bombyx mori]
MWTCAGLLALATCAVAITRDQFYPYGPELDQRLPRGSEVPSPEVTLNVPIVFYDETYETVFVNNHGVLTFRANLPQFINTEFPLPYPAIAAFYSNVDTTDEGAIYYRETNESHILSKAEESVQNNFHDYYDFRPTSVFITTWLDVTYTSTLHDRKNSYQVAVISNGTESFVELLYPEREIQWIQKETDALSLPDAKAQAGFVAEDGRVFTLRGSGSHQIRNIISWTNTHEPGKYVFRVGTIPRDSNIAVPDEYNETEIEIAEESKTCAQSGPSVCHMQARCVDYQAGICCQCSEGFYGNGKSCIKNDVPLRVHGKLNGVLNDVHLNDVDIQSYVVVADGRAYTALSLTPPVLGSSLQLLNIMGSVVGWLFAKPSSTAKNGYQLTGSLFNHSVDIWFPKTGDRVTVNQEYLGHDVFDQITLDADVRGSVPVILSGIKLDIGDFEEQYTIVEPGLIRSDSSRTFTNKITGETYEQRVSQTITYRACRYAPPSADDTIPSTLKVTKNYLGYETKNNIVRYGTSNKIVPLGQEDPCIEGRNTCGSYSTCVVQGDSFSCVCNKGFNKIYVDDVLTCVDIDECAAGTHNCDPNADCNNGEGDFQCRCKTGFIGNGIECSPLSISRCQSLSCDVNADCLENNGEEPICVCRPGYTGNGQQCYEVDERGCYEGSGCTERPPETTTAPNYESEYNETFVLPNCDYYGCTCPQGYYSFKDERNNDLCRVDTGDVPTPITDNNDTSIRCDSDSDCPPNAACIADPHQYSTDAESDQFLGHCVCPEGYVGDGYECIEQTGTSCNCAANAHCTETPTAELLCVCNTGYHGDGYVCRPNFSCTNNSDCEYNAECRPDTATNEYTCQCIEGFKKDQNEACIPDGQLCNGALCAEHASCLYDATIEISYCHCDEGFNGEGISQCVQTPLSCDLVNDCSPYASCVPADNTYQCVCQEGYLGDGYNCSQEINCRTDPYMCSPHASCIKNIEGYECECNNAYEGNGTFCVAKPQPPGNFLVTSDGTSIYRVPFKYSPREFATPINSGISQVAVSVSVDCFSGKIYWGDVVSNNIKRAGYDGSEFEQFLNTGIISPEGLAIDWSARNIFWTDSKKLTIEVANLDTKVRKVLFSVQNISNPRGIAVHPQRGKIFWTDWNRSNPKIEWANMDGTERSVLLGSPDVKLPNSVAIDWSRDRVCFADAGLQVIKCIDLHSRQIETIAENCRYPFGLAINGDKLYWSDWRTLKIEIIDTITQARGQIDIPRSTIRLYGVANAPSECPGAANVCSQRNGNCNAGQLCLPNGSGGRSCLNGDANYLP